MALFDYVVRWDLDEIGTLDKASFTTARTNSSLEHLHYYLLVPVNQAGRDQSAG